jgi:acyl-CoA thioesterase-1
MHPLVVHLASGQAFFTGTALIIFGVLVVTRPWDHRSGGNLSRGRGLAAGLGMLGLFLVLLSGTPVPLVVGIGWSIAFLAWIVLLIRPVRRDQTAGRAALIVPWLLALVSLLAVACELPWRFSPRLAPVRERAFTLIADSLSAGLGEKEAVTWPKLIAREHQVRVIDWSRQGETVGSALRRAPQSGVTTSLVILEIGGNDLLGPTTDVAFEQGLDALLLYARRGDVRGDRQIVMFELPLPPFRQQVGAIQRRLARKHNVHLIPKSILLDVIAGPDATVDGLHLSQNGHNRMAAAVWKVIGPALAIDGAPMQ